MKEPKPKATKSLMDRMQELGQKYGGRVAERPDGKYEESALMGSRSHL